jgi:hypothetical protein
MTPTIRKPSEGRTIAVVGDVYRFLATGEDTNGKYALWEALVPPGGGPPKHVIKGRFTTARPFRSALQTVIVGGLAAFVIAKAIG